MKIIFLSISLLLILGANCQTPCVDGFANGFPCNQVSFYSRLTPQELGATEHNGFNLNDIWGWTDEETGKEYVIVGLTDGVTFVNITDPSSPIPMGKLNEPSEAANRIADTEEAQHGKSNWRDMKVYKDHVFVISDGNGEHGMQVFDLTRLRKHDGSTFIEYEADTRYDGVSSAHNIVINEATGFAYIVGATTGSTCNGGGLHILNIREPLTPQYIGCFDEDGYTHDAQCVVYQGPDEDYNGKEVCFNSNEDSFTIVNVDDKSQMEMISRTSYENVRYSHQGWLTEDHRFFLMNDELDEFEFEFNPRTLIWNIEDLDNPVLAGEFYNEEVSVDHNLYVHENLIYESNYLSGLRILDPSRIEDGVLRERAFFDTYAEANEFHYGGTWSNYPFFESGTIDVSDMVNGLFLLKLDTTAQRITRNPENIAACEGTEISFNVQTDNTEATYQWQYFDGSRFVNLDENDLRAPATTQSLTAIASDEFVNIPLRCKVTDQGGNIFYSFPARYEFTGVLPDVSFSFRVMDKTVAFTNTTENATSYLWDFGDGETSIEENPTHEFPTPDVYNVQLKAFNNCGADSLTHSTAVILSVNRKNEAFEIYPNPASDHLIINIERNASLELVSLDGKILIHKKLNAGNHYLHLNNQLEGIYILKISIEGNTHLKKIIIR